MEQFNADKVRSERAKRKISQEELAVKVGATRRTIMDIEKGRNLPSISIFARIARLFGISLDDFYKG